MLVAATHANMHLHPSQARPARAGASCRFAPCTSITALEPTLAPRFKRMLAMCRYSQEAMRPWFATRPHTEPGRPAGFIATVILPANSPVLRVDGQWQPRKKQAGSHACLEAVKQLHKVCGCSAAL